MKKELQCKHIPERPILEFLLQYKHKGVLCTWYDDKSESHRPKNSVVNAVPPGTPAKLVHAKMCQLINRGVVKGCRCGCRGNFEITKKGEEELKTNTSTNPVTTRISSSEAS